MSCLVQRTVEFRLFFRCFRTQRNVFCVCLSNPSTKLNFSLYCGCAAGTNSPFQQKLTSVTGSGITRPAHFAQQPFQPTGYRMKISSTLLCTTLSRSICSWSKGMDNNPKTVWKMDLKEVLSALNKFAPTSLAESWDNVGLLVEPTSPHHVKTMFLTNDLTEEVLTEAINKSSDFILAYHPPIFVPLKRLTMRNAKERIIVQAIEKRIAVYSPHTCYDAVKGGVNDWLAEGLGPCSVEPIKTSQKPSYSGWTHRIEYEVPFSCSLPALPDVARLTRTPLQNGMQWTYCCNEQELLSVMKNMESLPEVMKTVQITKLENLPTPGTGTGRICQLTTPVSIARVVQLVKIHLGLQHVQLALGSQKTQDSEVRTVAICAGSGASVLAGVPADVYLTGEMSHHDILAAVARGTSVILCNHSNTERGYLRVLKTKLSDMLNGSVDIIVSEVDADPLNVV